MLTIVGILLSQLPDFNYPGTFYNTVDICTLERYSNSERHKLHISSKTDGMTNINVIITISISYYLKHVCILTRAVTNY